MIAACARWFGLWPLAAGEHDPRTILILFFASIAATFVYIDWTILTGYSRSSRRCVRCSRCDG